MSEINSSEQLLGRLEVLREQLEGAYPGVENKNRRDIVERHFGSLEKRIHSIESQAARFADLSPETQQELRNELERHIALKQAAYQRAQEVLEDIEDEIQEELEGKFVEYQKEAHRNDREARRLAARAAESYKKIQQETTALEEQRRSSLGEWARARADVMSSIRALYARLERLFEPSAPEWEPGHGEGEVHIPTAMQAVARPSLRDKMFSKRQSFVEREIAVSLLIDRSGSMHEEQKNESALRCAVMMSEVFSRLKLPFEIAVFDTASEVIKDFNRALRPAAQEDMAEKILAVRGDTNDYLAVSASLERILKRSEEHRFIIVLTDGGSSNARQLRATISEGLRRDIRIVGLGIGPKTDEVGQHYPLGRGGLSIDPRDAAHGLIPHFTKVLRQMMTNPRAFIRSERQLRNKKKK